MALNKSSRFEKVLSSSTMPLYVSLSLLAETHIIASNTLSFFNLYPTSNARDDFPTPPIPSIDNT
jgi:hypothetical protein